MKSFLVCPEYPWRGKCSSVLRDISQMQRHEAFLHMFRPLDPNEVKLITDVMQDLHGSFKVRACCSASACITIDAYACDKASTNCPYALKPKGSKVGRLHAGAACWNPGAQARR